MNESGKNSSINDVISSHYTYEEKTPIVNSYEDNKKSIDIKSYTDESTIIQNENITEQYTNTKNAFTNCSDLLCKLNNRNDLSEDKSKTIKISSHIIPHHDHRKIQSDTKDIEDDSRNNFVLEKKVSTGAQWNNIQEPTLQNKIVQR